MSHVCSHDLFIHYDVINVNVITCQITLLGHGYTSRLTCHVRKAVNMLVDPTRVPFASHNPTRQLARAPSSTLSTVGRGQWESAVYSL
jgi:hypothetical protein